MTMAIIDEVLSGIVAQIEPYATAADLVRKRGGIVRGVAWAEISGRGRDGTWYELRLHRRYRTGLLQSGLLAYRPLADGGRTEVIGELGSIRDDGAPANEKQIIWYAQAWLCKVAQANARYLAAQRP